MPFIWCHANHYSEPVLWITDSDFVDKCLDSGFCCCCSSVQSGLAVRHIAREFRFNFTGTL